MFKTGRTTTIAEINDDLDRGPSAALEAVGAHEGGNSAELSRARWGRPGRQITESRKPYRRRSVKVLAAAAILGGVAVAAAPTASATSLSAYPSFGCYANSSGGVIVGAPLRVNEDGRQTAYFAEVYRWSNNAWADYGPLYTSHGQVRQIFTDSIFGALNEDPVSAQVAHGYYQVVYYVASTGDTVVQHTNAGLTTARTWYNSLTCHL